MVKGGVKACDYGYLLSMSIGTLTLEKVQEICAERNKLKNELHELPRIGKNPEVGKPKPIGGEKKAAANMTIVLESDDNEDDELLELIMKMLMKDRLASCNLDSSSDQPAEEVTKEVPAKNAPATLLLQRLIFWPPLQAAKEAKKSTFAITEDDDDMDGDQMQTIVEDADDDEDFLMTEAAPKGKKGGGGRKPANAKAKSKAARSTRKRVVGAQGKQSLSQKLVMEVPKPVETASPEKKVRKMRESPLNKSSGSVMRKVEDPIDTSSGNLEAEMDEVRTSRNLPKRKKSG